MARKGKKSKRREGLTGSGVSDSPSAPPVGSLPTQRVEKVRILWETEPPTLHSDFAAVGVRSPGDFSLTLCSISAGEAKIDESGKLAGDARIVASVRMTPQAFFGLASLMMSQWNAFVASIGQKHPRFRGLEEPRPTPGETTDKPAEKLKE